MTQEKPEPLAQAETSTKERVDAELLRRNPEKALQFWEDAYHGFASTHSKQEADQYLKDTTAYYKNNGHLPEMEAAFGLDLKQDKALTPGARVSSADMKQIEKGSDPFKAGLASELEQDASKFLSENHKSLLEGGVPVAHWFGHPVDGVGVDDLNHYLDKCDATERAIKLQRDLLDGNSNSVFNKVAENAGKRPEANELYKSDFESFYNVTEKKIAAEKDENQKVLLQAQLDVVQRVLQNWDEKSGKLVSDDGQTDRHISKREMGVGRDVQDMYGQRVDGLVHRSADVLSHSGIFETIAVQRGQDSDSVRITAGDIDAFLRGHGGELSRYQYGVLREVVNRLTDRPDYHVLALIGEVQYDKQGQGYLDFSKSSVAQGQERYLGK